MIQICITSKEKSLFNQPLSFKLCNDIFDRHKMYEFTLWKKLISFTQPSANKPFLPYSIRAMNMNDEVWISQLRENYVPHLIVLLSLCARKLKLLLKHD